MIPRVSLLMAVYNGREYLPETMETVLGQTFGDFEFVILDDGSTDGVTDLLREYAANDARIKLIVRPNKGLTISLNEGLHRCAAPLIARIDGDDLCRPDRLEKQVAFMDAHPDVALLGGAYDLIDEHGRLLRTLTPPTDDDALQKHCLDGTTPICHPLAMFRREAALAVGGYDESYTVAQDIDLWLRLGEVGRMACLPDVLIGYRMHANSVSERKQAQQVANMKRACETAWMRRGTTGVFRGEAGWRAQDDTESKLRQTLKFGWWAFMSGENRTAMSYGVKAIRIAPLRASGWKLVGATLKHVGDQKHAS